MEQCHRVPYVISHEESLTCPENASERPDGSRHRAESTRNCLIADFVIAIAEGTPVTDWANKNKVPRRTAFRWAREPKVRAKVESCRRQVLDQAVGRLTDNISMAMEGILQLATEASSESVRLAALRTVASDMMALSKFGGLEDRMTKLEEKLHARAANTPRSH